eukprot:2466807-Amphidinium_carterae.1
MTCISPPLALVCNQSRGVCRCLILATPPSYGACAGFCHQLQFVLFAQNLRLADEETQPKPMETPRADLGRVVKDDMKKYRDALGGKASEKPKRGESTRS